MGKLSPPLGLPTRPTLASVRFLKYGSQYLEFKLLCVETNSSAIAVFVVAFRVETSSQTTFRSTTTSSVNTTTLLSQAKDGGLRNQDPALELVRLQLARHPHPM
jgi:hypothetical protein